MEQHTESASPITWEELLESYCHLNRIKTDTAKSYINVVRRFRLRYPDVLPEQLTHRMLLEWRAHMLDSNNPGHIKPTSWNNYIGILSGLIHRAGERGLIPEPSPILFKRLRAREPRMKTRVLADGSLKLYRNYLSQLEQYETSTGHYTHLHPAWFYRCILETFYHTGMRQIQLRHLCPSDIDLANQLIHLRPEYSKNNREYSIPISDELQPYLAQILDRARQVNILDHEQLFNVNRFRKTYSDSRKPMSRSQLQYFFVVLSACTGQHVSSHRFRHTVGTELMKEPERNIYLVMELLGHVDIRSTLRYVSADLNQIRNLLNNRI